MLKKSCIYTIAVILGINYSSLAGNISATDKAAFKKHAELCKAQEQINFESSKIFSDYKYQLEKYISSLKALKSGKQPDINRSVKSLEQQKKYAERSIKSYETSLKRLKQKIDSIKTDKVKQAETDKLYLECNKLKAQIDKLNQPYTQRIREYMAKIDVNAERPKVKASITPLIKQVPGLVSKIKEHIFYDSFYIDCDLYNDNKKVGWMNISLKPIKRAHKKEKLAGKYKIYAIYSSKNMYFNVKDFHISFQINDKSIQSKKQLKKFAKKLIDLPGLEKLSGQETIQKWLAAAKLSQEINNKCNAATGKLNSEYFKLRSKINNLSREGFKSSAEIKRLNAAYLHATYRQKNNKETIATANFLLKQLKSPATSRKMAIQAIEKKIADLKNEIFNYCEAVNKKKALLSKNIDFAETNKQYQILARTFVRLPESKELLMPNRKEVDAWLGTPQIKCRWEQDLSTGQHPSINTIFVGKISYRPDYILSNSKGMMDNKYPIIDDTYSLTLRVGDFNVSIYSAENNLYGRDINKKIIKELYDLDAIAGITK